MNTHTTTMGAANTTAARIVRNICSDSDGQNRRCIYTLYSDGSAMSREFRLHCGDPARRTQCTWEQRHDVGSEMAVLINRLADMPELPAGWFDSHA